jgi:hypothetical protein
MAEENVIETEIVFESTGKRKDLPQTLRISGPTDLRNAPEKVRQLMELLDLPKGTKATIKVTAASSIIR